MTAKTDIQKMQDTLKWAIAIMISLLVFLIGGAVRAEMKNNVNAADIEKIKSDYLPYFAYQYIVESQSDATIFNK